MIEPVVTVDIVTVITGCVNKFFTPCVKSCLKINRRIVKINNQAAHVPAGFGAGIKMNPL
jgi:hypothetical protein